MGPDSFLVQTIHLINLDKYKTRRGNKLLFFRLLCYTTDNQFVQKNTDFCGFEDALRVQTTLK